MEEYGVAYSHEERYNGNDSRVKAEAFTRNLSLTSLKMRFEHQGRKLLDEERRLNIKEQISLMKNGA